jgi:iron complex transport system ATP-binding protein
MGNNVAVAVRDLSFSYRKEMPVLKNIDATFGAGKITAIMGANGCGKSTLLRLIAGVMRADSGEILLGGKNIKDYKRNALAKKIAVVHQSNVAPSDMTVQKLVAAGRTPYQTLLCKHTAADEAAVEKALRDTDTRALAERAISSLSGGQLQRVWLAMALAQEPDILLLDELTTYLDIHYQLEMMHLVRELNRKNGLTVIMVLHDINLAFRFCDEAVMMKGGSILAQGEMMRAVTTNVLDEAFEVTSDLVTKNGKPYCMFSRKGD